MVIFNKVVKIKNGLLEINNPFLYSKINDFSCVGIFNRDDEKIELHSGFIERNFDYKQFVLIVEKEPKSLKENDKIGIYTRKSVRRSGIMESGDGDNIESQSATHWKLIYYNGFVQTYLSFDNMNEWITLGGGQNVEETDVQGFSVEGGTSLVIKSYNVFDNPYVTFLNIPNEYYIEIYNEKEELKYIKKSQNEMVEIYLNSPINNGYFKIFDNNDNEVYMSEELDINLGDVFSETKYELEVYCKGLINQYTTTHIDKLEEVISVKNISTYNYENIGVNISLPNSNIDKIEISLDKVNYSNQIIIPILNSGESIDIFLKIDKNVDKENYGLKNFSISFV